ncbi:DUF5320 domain-containing protein [Desulfobacula sp.]|uniref:DUF5320 domain-containing protein n=1 Tax=Desulfobacula sp. TaxID=2593537 RepID=UPI00260ACE23|nr:DUF5320 domain-containing protein [Desulfobacula sp.]
MPGFNQRGPMNEGAMTGRGRGNCTGAGNPDQGFAGRGNVMGMGRQRGKRGYQDAPGQGMGGGRWAGAAPAPITASGNQDTLQNSVDRLETELAALKNQLKNLSESRE